MHFFLIKRALFWGHTRHLLLVTALWVIKQTKKQKDRTKYEQSVYVVMQQHL
jgi:hypothetical protein